jgi:hypothetical protein
MDKKIYDGILIPVSGSTPFGYFDNDLSFQLDAPKIAKHITYKLGYPILDVELRCESVYACIEEAILTYSSEVNKFNIKDNMLSLQGVSTAVDITHKELTPNLGRIITISKEYGSETGSGGNITYKKGYIETEDGKQIYDLSALWSDVHESGNEIEIKRVFHFDKPAVNRGYTPYGGMDGVNTSNILSDFGWANMSMSSTFMMTPVYDSLLKVQGIEFNDMIRKSAYSFHIINNNLYLHPIPTGLKKVWFEYIVVKDRNNPLKLYTDASGSFISGSLDNTRASDFSNVPYGVMQYKNINSPGKSWIREYSLGLSKELLGMIRGKYQSVPFPDSSEITLDSDALRSEGQAMKEELMTSLREMLEGTSKQALMEAKNAESENMMNIMNRIPLPIFIA